MNKPPPLSPQELVIHYASCAICGQPAVDQTDVAGVTVVRAATGQGKVVGFKAHARCLASVLRSPTGDHVMDIFAGP